MAKVVLLFAVAFCLLASSYPLFIDAEIEASVSAALSIGLGKLISKPDPKPEPKDGGSILGKILGSLDLGILLKPVGGVLYIVKDLVGGVTTVLTKTLVSVTQTLGGLLEVLLKTVIQLVDALLKLVLGLLYVIVHLLKSLLDVPIKTVNNLVVCLNVFLKPININIYLKASLDIHLHAGKDLAKQLAGTVAISKCQVNHITANITTEILKSTLEILACANPLLKDVNAVLHLVSDVVEGTGDFVGETLEAVKKCTSVNANSGDPSIILACLLNPVKKALNGTGLLVKVTVPIINNALNHALGITTCATKVLKREIIKANIVLEGVVKCAADVGVPCHLPRLPSCSTNFTAVAEGSLSKIQDLSTAAVGAKSPLNGLTAAITKLQITVNVTSPLALQVAVNKSISGTRAALDAIKLDPKVAASTNPVVAKCITDAQQYLNQFNPLALIYFLQCTADVDKNATNLVKVTTQLDVALKGEAVKAGVDAFAKCSQYALTCDNSAKNCFDAAENEVSKFYNEQLKKVNGAIAEANALINRTEDCLKTVLNAVDVEGQNVIRVTKICLANNGVVVETPENIQPSITAGEQLIAKAVVDASSTVSVVNSNNENIKGAVEFIKTINNDLLSSIISPIVLSGRFAVSEVRGSLANNPNPAVTACLDATESRLSLTESEVIVTVNACVQTNVNAANVVANKSAAELANLKKKLDNAVAEAVAQCNKSVSSVAADNCFANAKQNLNSEAKNSQDRMDNLVAEAQLALNEAVACTNAAANNAAVKVDAELSVLKTCLAAQGVVINVSRS